jgi:RNA processing factor Prp31
MRIKKLGTLIVAGVIMCTTPAMPVMASDAVESVQEIISDNEIDSLVSDPDKVVDIIMYVKDAVADQDISDDQIKEVIQTAENTVGVSLTDENKIVTIVKQVKNSDINEEQLRSTVTKVYDKLEEMGIGKEEVKGILHKLFDFAKSLFN